MRRLVVAFIPLAACGGKQPAVQPGADTVEEVWTVNVATDGSCVATPHCVPLTGAACTDPAPTGVVQFAVVNCIAGAKEWRIVETARDHACRIETITCDKPGCDTSVERSLACPDFPTRTAAEAPPETSEPVVRWWEQSNPCPAETKLDRSGGHGTEITTYSCMTVCAAANQDCDKHAEGPSTTLWQNGQVLANGRYHDGNRIGHWTFASDTENVVARGTFDEIGSARDDWHFTVSGKPAFFESGGAGCPPGTKLVAEKPGIGAFEARCELPGGAKHGPRFKFQGRQLIITAFDHDIEVGPWKRWDLDRGVRMEQTFAKDGQRRYSADYMGRKVHEIDRQADGSEVERDFNPDGTVAREEKTPKRK